MSDRSGHVHPGDKILAINGQDISTSGQDFVSSLLQVSTRYNGYIKFYCTY